MSTGTILKAKTFLLNQQVVLTSAGPLGIFFEVGSNKRVVSKRYYGVWTCDCHYFSIHWNKLCFA